MNELNQIMREFPNYKSIVDRFKDGGDTWLPDDFPARAYARDVLFWYVRLEKLIHSLRKTAKVEVET